jgi:hypothetical protein
MSGLNLNDGHYELLGNTAVRYVRHRFRNNNFPLGLKSSNSDIIILLFRFYGFVINDDFHGGYIIKDCCQSNVWEVLSGFPSKYDFD